MDVRVNAVVFKKIVAGLKGILNDVNLHFYHDGFRIVGMDPDRVCVIQQTFRLDGYTFTNDEPIYIGIYLPFFYKLLRGVTKDHDLKLTVNKDTPEVIQIRIESHDQNVDTVLALKSHLIPVEDVIFPKVEYDAMVEVNTAEMHRLVRDAMHLSPRVSIGYSGKELMMSACGNAGVSTMSLVGNKWIQESDDQQHGQYLSKVIEKMLKVEFGKILVLGFKRGEPLAFYYDQPGIGSLNAIIAEIKE